MLTKTNARLESFSARVVSLEGTISDCREEIAEIWQEAKSEGFTVKALKQAIKIHSMDQDKRAKFDAEQTDLLLYLEQLEGRIEA